MTFFQPRDLEAAGPMKAEHALVGIPCPACDKLFKIGDHTALIKIGPGGSEVERRACRENRWYNAIYVQVHWECATGNAIKNSSRKPKRMAKDKAASHG